MGLPIASHKPCPVHRKEHRQVLDTYIVQDLIIGPLQEGGVDRHHGPEPRRRHACGRRDCMGLRDSHVKKPVRKLLSEGSQPRTVRHGGSNRHQFRMLLPQLTQLSGEHVRIGRIGLG